MSSEGRQVKALPLSRSQVINVSGSHMHSIEQVKILLAETLNLGQRINNLRADSYLLGSIPELDSMAVVNIVAALEEQFGIVIEDDELTASIFDTVGSLAAFVDQKLAQ
jgi:acyl carrier protein